MKRWSRDNPLAYGKEITCPECGGEPWTTVKGISVKCAHCDGRGRIWVYDEEKGMVP